MNVGLRPGSSGMCHLLREDLDLAEVLPPDRREEAIEDCTVPELSLPARGARGQPGVR